MSDPAEIQAIMDICKNLKGAADHMEKYSICYDMTKEEKDKIKELINGAKDIPPPPPPPTHTHTHTHTYTQTRHYRCVKSCAKKFFNAYI